MNKKTVSELREAGFEGCKIVSPQHYKNKNQIEPLDLIISLGMLEDFCLGNIIKYASRYKATKQQKDLQKIVDYAYILYGYNREV